MSHQPALLFDQKRLEAVSAVLPEVAGPDEDFDRIARLAAKALMAPTCLITLMGSTTQNFRGVCGAPAAMGDEREGSNENSLCRHTVLEGDVVSITNAKADPAFAGNPIVNTVGIRAYLGIPLVNSSGHTLGSICAIDYLPREWEKHEIEALIDHAAVATAQLESVAKSTKISSAFDVALHDLKTPLSGLLMATSLVAERMKSIPEEIHPLLKVVEASTAAAMKLVETLSAEKRKATADFI